MKTKRTVALICVVLAVSGLAYWYFSSGHLFTQTEQMVEVKVKDEIFGTETTRQEWRKDFQLGLEYTAAAVGPLLLIAVGLFWSAARDAKRANGSR